MGISKKKIIIFVNTGLFNDYLFLSGRLCVFYSFCFSFKKISLLWLTLFFLIFLHSYFVYSFNGKLSFFFFFFLVRLKTSSFFKIPFLGFFFFLSYWKRSRYLVYGAVKNIFLLFGLHAFGAGEPCPLTKAEHDRL